MSIVQDRSLRLHQFDPLADIEPDDVLYQTLTADSSTASNYTFVLKNPAPNSLMDNEVWIEYTMTLTGADFVNMFTNAAGAAVPGRNRIAWNLRDGFTINKGIRSLNVTLNGQNFSNRPYIWQSVLEHLYFSREESENLLSLSGGAFDTGNGMYVGKDRGSSCQTQTVNAEFANPAVAAAGRHGMSQGWGGSISAAVGADLEQIMVGIAPPQSAWVNQGWDKRFAKLGLASRTDNSTADWATENPGNAFYSNPITLTMYEKLPIFPFKTFDNKDLKMSIPNVRDLSINVTYLGGDIFKGNVLQKNNHAGVAGQNAVDVHSTPPKIHLKWYNTKMPIPASVNLPATIVREYEENFKGITFVNNLAFSNILTKTFRPINLEAVPDLLIIYYSRDPDSRGDNVLGTGAEKPSQYHLSIEKFKINVGGSTGRMNNISQGELYAHYLRNVRHNGTGKKNYDEWRRYNCTIAIRPRDIGITWGPGFNYPVQIQMQVDLRSYYNVPTVLRGTTRRPEADGNQADLIWKQYVVAIYDRMAYQINSDGTSKLEMLKLPLTPVQSQTNASLQQPTSAMQSILGL